MEPNLKIEKCPGCGGSGAMMQYWPMTGKRKGYGPCMICDGSGRVRVSEEIKRGTG